MMYIMDMAKEELKKKNDAKVPVPIRLKPELFERLENYCANGNWVRNSVVEKAVEQYLDREEKKK